MKRILKEYFLSKEDVVNGEALKNFLTGELDSLYFEREDEESSEYEDEVDEDDRDETISQYCKENHEGLLDAINAIPDDVTFNIKITDVNDFEEQLEMPTLWLETSDAFDMWSSGDASGIDSVLSELLTWVTDVLPKFYSTSIPVTEDVEMIEEKVSLNKDFPKGTYKTREVNKTTGKQIEVTWQAEEFDENHNGWLTVGKGEDGSSWVGTVFATENMNVPDWGTLDVYTMGEGPKTELRESTIDLVRARIYNDFYDNWTLDSFLAKVKNATTEAKLKVKNEFLTLKNKVKGTLDSLDWDKVNKNVVYKAVQETLNGDLSKASEVAGKIANLATTAFTEGKEMLTESQCYYCSNCGERAEHEEISEARKKGKKLRCSNCGGTSWVSENEYEARNEDVSDMRKSSNFVRALNEDSSFTEHKELEPGDRVKLLATPQIKQEMYRKLGTHEYAGTDAEVVRISGLPGYVVVDIGDSGMTVDVPLNWIESPVEIMESGPVDTPQVMTEEIPGGIGHTGREAHVLYRIDNDAYSFIPKDLKTWYSFTDRTLLNKLTYFRDENDYQSQKNAKKFFLIWYNGKLYLYLNRENTYNGKKGTLYDQHENIIDSSKVDPTFMSQMEQIIKNSR